MPDAEIELKPNNPALSNMTSTILHLPRYHLVFQLVFPLTGPRNPPGRKSANPIQAPILGKKLPKITKFVLSECFLPPFWGQFRGNIPHLRGSDRKVGSFVIFPFFRDLYPGGSRAL